MFGSNYFGHPYFAQGYATPVGAYEDLSGIIATVSSLSGALYRTRPISGQIDGVAALSGELFRTRPLLGQIDAIAALSGNIYRTRGISGLVPIVASVSGNLYLTLGLSGAIATVSTLSANMHPFRGISGTIAATAALSGLLYRIRDIDGNIEAAAILTADLWLVGRLQGTCAIQAFLVATLDTIIAEPFRPPRGQAIGGEGLEAASRLSEGLAAQGVIAKPILPGRGEGSRTPAAYGRVTALPSGAASGRATPRSGSAGLAGAVEGHGTSHPVSHGAGNVDAVGPRNLDENPSFESNLDGVSVGNGTVTRSDTKARYGSYSCRAEQTTAPLAVFKKCGEDYFPVTAGEVYVHSVSGQMESGDAGTVFVGIQWYDEGENLLSTVTSGSYFLDDSTWTEGEHEATAPASTAFAKLIILAYFDDGEAVYLDGQGFRHAERSLTLDKGQARASRTKEGEAETDRPPHSGKAR